MELLAERGGGGCDGCGRGEEGVEGAGGEGEGSGAHEGEEGEALRGAAEGRVGGEEVVVEGGRWGWVEDEQGAGVGEGGGGTAGEESGCVGCSGVGADAQRAGVYVPGLVH